WFIGRDLGPPATDHPCDEGADESAHGERGKAYDDQPQPECHDRWFSISALRARTSASRSSSKSWSRSLTACTRNDNSRPTDSPSPSSAVRTAAVARVDSNSARDRQGW